MLKYWLWLTTRKGLGARGAYLVARHFSSPQAAYFADPKAYEAIDGLRDPSALMDKNLNEAEKILRQCYDQSISILTLQDAAYPQRLLAVDDPPLVLYYKGTLPDFDSNPVIGVVGTRKYTPYGYSAAKKLGHEIASCGGIVVSGGAKGIDTMALESALAAGGVTVAVLAGGLDKYYPAVNTPLFRKMCNTGCLISEYPPGTPANNWHFPIRNRIISGIANGLLVVEAPAKSGALISARHAMEQGRDV